MHLQVCNIFIWVLATSAVASKWSWKTKREPISSTKGNGALSYFIQIYVSVECALVPAVYWRQKVGKQQSKQHVEHKLSHRKDQAPSTLSHLTLWWSTTNKFWLNFSQNSRFLLMQSLIIHDIQWVTFIAPL